MSDFFLIHSPTSPSRPSGDMSINFLIEAQNESLFHLLFQSTRSAAAMLVRFVNAN